MWMVVLALIVIAFAGGIYAFGAWGGLLGGVLATAFLIWLYSDGGTRGTG